MKEFWNGFVIGILITIVLSCFGLTIYNSWFWFWWALSIAFCLYVKYIRK